MIAVFAPLAEFIWIRPQQLETENNEMAEVHNLLTQMSKLTGPALVADLVDRFLARPHASRFK